MTSYLDVAGRGSADISSVVITEAVTSVGAREVMSSGEGSDTKDVTTDPLECLAL